MKWARLLSDGLGILSVLAFATFVVFQVIALVFHVPELWMAAVVAIDVSIVSVVVGVEIDNRWG